MRALVLFVVVVGASTARAAPGEATFFAMPSARGPTFTLQINGVAVFPSKTPTKVPLSKRLDAVEVRRGRSRMVFFARFSSGAEYDVRANPCSLFEVIPRVEGEALPRLTLEVEGRARGPVHFEGVGEAADLEPGARHTVEVGRSAMCLHAPVVLTATQGAQRREASFLIFGGGTARALSRANQTLNLELDALKTSFDGSE